MKLPEKIERPKCPVCGELTVMSDPTWRCVSDDCPLPHFFRYEAYKSKVIYLSFLIGKDRYVLQRDYYVKEQNEGVTNV